MKKIVLIFALCFALAFCSTCTKNDAKCVGKGKECDADFYITTTGLKFCKIPYVCVAYKCVELNYTSSDEKCYLDTDCEGEEVMKCEKNKCVAYAGYGDSCAELKCVGDLKCNGDKVCVGIAENETCDNTVRCNPGLYCGIESKCVPFYEKEGDSCTVACINPLLFCDEGKCVAKYTKAKDKSCILGYECDKETTCIGGKCVEADDELVKCSQDSDCLADYECDCRLEKDEGICEVPDDLMCKEKRIAAEKCVIENGCESGYFDGSCIKENCKDEYKDYEECWEDLQCSYAKKVYKGCLSSEGEEMYYCGGGASIVSVGLALIFALLI